MLFVDNNLFSPRSYAIKMQEKADYVVVHTIVWPFFSVADIDKYIHFQCSSGVKSANFFHFWIIVFIFDCCTLHSMSIFLFVRDVVRAVLFGMWVVVSLVSLCQCPLYHFPIIPSTPSQQSPLSCALTKPSSDKEPSQWKESRACCVTTFCVLFFKLFFKRQEAICLQTKSSALVLPPSNLAGLKYLRVVYSSSAPSDLAVETHCMVWYVLVS